MSDTVIRVENLGKKYIIGHQSKERYTALRDVIANQVKSLGNLVNPKAKIENPNFEEFWALKDVSFDIKQGDRVGIIGRNGAGKSTLLKILSRITEPTTGRINIKGRVASLLEVGTGFHPELTGRENIFLNGAVLGMSKEEIKRKFDEIVAFAEIEKFLDTPVKRYSSGMYVRLAFAVAAHLEPEILIVDEVLAVGDAQFQKKCLGKMEDVGKEGRTVIFVSHSMSTIKALCNRCCFFSMGSLQYDGLTSKAVQLYLDNSTSSKSFNRELIEKEKPSIVSGGVSMIHISDEQYVQLDLEIYAPKEQNLSLDLRLLDSTGIAIGFGSLGALRPSQLVEVSAGLNPISLAFPINQLATGSYIISLDLTLPRVRCYERLNSCLSFDVLQRNSENYGQCLQQSWGYGSFEIPVFRRN